MKINEIEEINKYGFVRAFAVPKDDHRWRIYSYNVKDNMHDLKYYKELAECFGISTDDMVRIMQTHTANIYIAKKGDGGLGVTRKEPDIEYDGFITNEKGLMLLTIQSDCTPVFILDPKNKAVGLVHSGWRGTVKNITKSAIELMNKNYGSNIEDLIIHFGPAICGNCYEVGMELIDEFKKLLACDEIHKVFKPIIDKEEKYTLDVTEAIRLSLLKIGIKQENISRDKICTCHDNIYASWRRDHDKTKQMIVGIMLVN